jgi:hypothetical protein
MITPELQQILNNLKLQKNNSAEKIIIQTFGSGKVSSTDPKIVVKRGG